MKKVRFGLVFFVFTSAFSAVGFHLYRLQVEKTGVYLARAESQRVNASFLAPERGAIYVRDKETKKIAVAVNRDYPMIYAVPEEIKNPAAVAGQLSPLLKIDRGALLKKLSKRKDAFEMLVPRATPEETAKMKEAAVKGIYIGTNKGRFYPFGTLAAHAIGFVGSSGKDDDVKGRYGIEVYFDETLRGKPGSAEGDTITKPTPGRDVTLTIDRNIQARAEELLQGLIEKYRAEGGTVIVQEPTTGKILALGNYPTFDPNRYSESSISSFLNQAVQGMYEPGSVFKVITVSAGLNTGAVTPETTYTDTGSLTINGKTIRNWDDKVYGVRTIAEVIENSINTGAAFVERALGHEKFYEYIVRFGFADLTGIALPGEVKSNMNALTKRPQDINFATASFGQGVAVTPIQIINAVSAVANGGMLMKPIIIDGETPTPVRRIISPQAADAMTRIMVSSVKKNILANIPNYLVAGKTGTAQIPDFKSGGYTEEVIHSYIGFMPATKPRAAILIKLDKPKGVALAGFTVVGAFHDLAEFILNYYNIPPDDLARGTAD